MASAESRLRGAVEAERVGAFPQLLVHSPAIAGVLWTLRTVNVSTKAKASRYTLLALVAGDTEFGLLYSDDSTTEPGTYVQRVAPQGGLLGTRVLVTTQIATEAALQQAQGGSWYAFWAEAANSGVRGAQLTADKTKALDSQLLSNTHGYASSIASAQSGDQVGLAYVDSSYLSRISSSLAAPQDQPLFSQDQSCGWLAIGGNSTGYGAVCAASDKTNWRFLEVGRDGVMECGPVELPTPSEFGGNFSMVRSRESSGWLIGVRRVVAAARDPESIPALQVVGAGCKAQSSLLPLSTDGGRISTVGPFLAAIPSSIVAVGSSSLADLPQEAIYYRVMGDQLCDSPG